MTKVTSLRWPTRHEVTGAERKKLMHDYMDELQMIQGDPLYTESEQDQLFRHHVSEVEEGFASWYDITDENGLFGMLIICRATNCHPDADFFIEQAYIDPKHRNSGVMSEVITNFIQHNPGVYCLFTLSNNTAAQQFWKNTFADAGYKPCTLRKIADDDDGRLVQFGFRPANNGIQRPC